MEIKENAMNYIVTEIQVMPEGQVASITNAYPDERQALSRYHQALSAAAVSGLPIHSAIMYDERGFYLRSDYFETVQPEPEPEPEPEPIPDIPEEETHEDEEEEEPIEDEEEPVEEEPTDEP